MILARPHILRPPTFGRFSVNGSSDNIQYPNAVSINAWTIALWYAPDHIATSGNNNTVGFFISGGQASLVWDSSGTRQTWYNYVSGAIYATYPTILPAGQFNHLVGVNDGTHLIAYLNGLPVAQTSTGAPNGSGAGWAMQLFGSSGNTSAGGTIPQATFWNAGLSPSDVLKVYRSGTPQTVRRSSILAHFQPTTATGLDLDPVTRAVWSRTGTTPAPWQQRIMA